MLAFSHSTSPPLNNYCLAIIIHSLYYWVHIESTLISATTQYQHNNNTTARWLVHV